MATKVCSAKPNRNVHMNVHTKRERINLLRKLTALGISEANFNKEVTLHTEMKKITLNLNLNQ
jgi:hypothetical protein